jgi:hypothetical protein
LFNQQSAINNQQFLLLAFAERKLLTQLVYNYFPDEKGPAWHCLCERVFLSAIALGAQADAFAGVNP